MNISHHWCRQEAKHKNLRCWSSRCTQTGAYEQSRWYEMVCHIKKRAIGPCEQAMRTLQVRAKENSNSGYVCMLQVTARRLYISAERCSSALCKPSYNSCKPQTSKQLNWEGGTSCLASTDFQCERLSFLFVGSYQMKNISQLRGSHGRVKNRIRNEICQTSQEILTKFQDNTKLRLNYKMKVDSGYIEINLD